MNSYRVGPEVVKSEGGFDVDSSVIWISKSIFHTSDKLDFNIVRAYTYWQG